MAVINGGAGNDPLTGTLSGDQIFGDDGNDTIQGKGAGDELDGGRGDDLLIGGGNDTFYGGEGNDTIRFVPGGYEAYIIPSHGNDTYDFRKATSGAFFFDFDGFFTDGYGIRAPTADKVDITIRDKSATIVKTFTTETSTDTFKNLNKVPYSGDLDPESLPITFWLGDGDDTVTVNRKSGPALWINTGGGDVVVNGSMHTVEVLRPQARNPEGALITIEKSVKGQMAGTVVQNDPNSTLKATVTFKGIDVVEGSSGNDLMLGSSGRDHFRPMKGNDGFDGGDGFDTVDYSHSENVLMGSVDVDLQAGWAVKTFTTTGPDIYEDGLANVEGVIGSRGDDILRGSNVANRLEGGDGDDRLLGRRGADTLVGGEGDDILNGGADADVFVFDMDSGRDTVRGYEAGLDRLRIEGSGLAFKDVELVDLGRHTLVTVGDLSILLTGIDPSALGKADFIFA